MFLTVDLFEESQDSGSCEDILIEVSAWILRDLDQMRYANVVVADCRIIS